MRTTTTYLSRNVVKDQLSAAQAVLDRHVMSCVDGRCQACRAIAPCPESELAADTFARLQALPR